MLHFVFLFFIRILNNKKTLKTEQFFLFILHENKTILDSAVQIYIISQSYTCYSRLVANGAVIIRGKQNSTPTAHKTRCAIKNQNHHTRTTHSPYHDNLFNDDDCA